jgi:hypothetical protein
VSVRTRVEGERRKADPDEEAVNGRKRWTGGSGEGEEAVKGRKR